MKKLLAVLVLCVALVSDALANVHLDAGAYVGGTDTAPVVWFDFDVAGDGSLVCNGVTYQWNAEDRVFRNLPGGDTFTFHGDGTYEFADWPPAPLLGPPTYSTGAYAAK